MRKEKQSKNQNGETKENVSRERPRRHDYYRDEAPIAGDADRKRRGYSSSGRGWNDYNGEDQFGRGEEGQYVRGSVSIRRRPKSMNFEEYAAQGNRFIKDVAEELQTDRDTASRVTRAIIHALRDRLPPDDAIQFAQGLPMALKGVFLDQYDISKTPVVIRKADEFLDYIRYKDRFAAIRDFPAMNDVVIALRAVFHVFEMHMDKGQVNQVLDNLPTPIVKLIDPAW